MTEATTILYLSHGRDEFHLQAQLSILTLLHFLRDSDLDYWLVVYTDAPWKFEKYGVETVVLDEDQIRQWRGAYNFVHRVKIMTLADASERSAGTCFSSTPTPISPAHRSI
jgi:hypothetical protein